MVCKSLNPWIQVTETQIKIAYEKLEFIHLYQLGSSTGVLAAAPETSRSSDDVIWTLYLCPNFPVCWLHSEVGFPSGGTEMEVADPTQVQQPN